MDKSGTDNVTISIVMPVYNCEMYLSDAIESVLTQSFSEWELIVVDDGSKDGSGRICDTYCQKDSRVKVFHTENRGVSKARNYGVQQAKGIYIEFMDGDDLLLPNTLQNAYESIGDSELLIFGYESFPVQKTNCTSEERRYTSLDELAEVYSQLASEHLINSSWNKLYKRELILSYNLRFPEKVSLGEDLLFNLSYLGVCHGILVVPKVLYRYRREESSSLSARFRKENFEIQRLLKEETDRCFEYREKVARHTGVDFVNAIIGNIQACVYSRGMKKSEKTELITEWITDDFFVKTFFYVRDEKLEMGHALKVAIRKKWVTLIYCSYSLRRFISKTLKAVFK